MYERPAEVLPQYSVFTMLFLLLHAAHALSLRPTPALRHQEYLNWFEKRQAPPEDRPEPAYRFHHDVHAAVAPFVRERPGVITPVWVGKSLEGRPIWGFRIKNPAGPPIEDKVLVFAGIHALEWISTDVATSFLLDLVQMPPDGIEVVVIPVLNRDGRARVEADLLAGDNTYRRGNANQVDLNRDFEANREPTAFWASLLPGYYQSSPGPLSQPESQALDALAATEAFDVTVSLHAFGGFIYAPWGGRFSRPPDWKLYKEVGHAMAAEQKSHAYKVRQLSHWWFLFRIQGAELDHFYQKYGSLSYLVELTRSGWRPFKWRTFKQYFRWYNPTRSRRHIERGVGALRGLMIYLDEHGPIETVIEHQEQVVE